MLEKRKNRISTLLVRFDVEITIFLHSNWTDPNYQNTQVGSDVQLYLL